MGTHLSETQRYTNGTHIWNRFIPSNVQTNQRQGECEVGRLKHQEEFLKNKRNSGGATNGWQILKGGRFRLENTLKIWQGLVHKGVKLQLTKYLRVQKECTKYSQYHIACPLRKAASNLHIKRSRLSYCYSYYLTQCEPVSSQTFMVIHSFNIWWSFQSSQNQVGKSAL